MIRGYFSTPVAALDGILWASLHVANAWTDANCMVLICGVPTWSVTEVA